MRKPDAPLTDARGNDAALFSLIENAPLGACVLDANLRVVALNKHTRAALTLNGSEAALGQDFAEATRSLWSVEYAGDLTRLFQRTLDTGEPLDTTEQAAKGDAYEWRVDRVALLDGAPALVCYFRNASVTTPADSELAAVKEQLQDADRRKEEFLAMLAHELRNPLAPIRTGLELIRIAGDTQEAVERVRTTMDRQVGHMVRLIDDLLDVSRITSGKIRLQRQPTPIATIINMAVEANRAAISENRIALVIDVPDVPVVLDVDSTRFVQIISNLLNNAVKFSPPRGRVRITAKLHPSRKSADAFHVTVSDAGAGISSEMLPRVFDLFSQGDAQNSEGLGVGLALARRLVEMHGASIEAASDGTGRGSSFTIKLPLSIVVPELTAEAAAQVPEIKRRVVVIDDNADSADMMAMFVSAIGGESRVAYGGEEGISLVVDYKPDVVLLDIGMPGMDGYETCRRIRSEVGNGVFVVAMTGFGQARDRQEARNAGFDEHLTKPVDPTMLRRVLADARVST